MGEKGGSCTRAGCATFEQIPEASTLRKFFKSETGKPAQGETGGVPLERPINRSARRRREPPAPLQEGSPS